MSSRNIAIDILRIVAIAMVVLSHIVLAIYVRPDFFGGSSWFASFLTITVSRLGVPIFFIISGFLLVSKERSFRENIIHTLKRLIIPFLIWTVFTYIDLAITGNLPALNADLILSGGGTQYYFLIGLAIIYLLNPAIRIITNKAPLRVLQLLIIVLGISTIGQTTISFFLYHVTNDSVFNYWFFGLFYFIYGQYFYAYRKQAKMSFSWGAVLFFVPLVINLVLIYLIRSKGYSGQDLYLESYFGPTVLLSSLGLFNVVMNINFQSLNEKIKAIIVRISNLSFGVYLIHAIILDLILHETAINPYGKVTINLWLYLILTTVIVIPLSYVFSFLLSKNKYGRITLGL